MGGHVTVMDSSSASIRIIPSLFIVSGFQDDIRVGFWDCCSGEARLIHVYDKPGGTVVGYPAQSVCTGYGNTVTSQ